MSDILNISTYSDVAAPGAVGYTPGTQVDTGDLRRKFNFGDRVSELSLSQDPFFRILSMVSKKPTDDPQFKFTERRGSYHKRYAYIAAHAAAFATDGDTALPNTAGASAYFKMYTDWNSSGNKSNIYGQAATNYKDQTGSQPEFFIPGQILKINVNTAASQSTVSDYQLVKITNVDLDTANYAKITGVVIKAAAVHATVYMLDETTGSLTGVADNGAAQSQEALEPYKCYVVGTVFDEGSGYPETWDDQPFSTSYGRTQIFKTSMAMNNTDRATVLKYEGNEWARIWKEKLIEHKWDIEQSLLFGQQNETYRTTQGAVDWVGTYGNAFTLDTATKTQDDFLDDLSSYLDPRYNNGMATVFFVSTAVYNWLHKLGGYFNNNLSIGSNFRADFAVMGKKKVMGLDATTISTVYGDMNVVRNIHLDGTNIKMLGVNMKYCAYRPLVGNGINRDTSVYVGVQTLENSGVDRRVDQILTEAGMEWCCPETHAVWTA
jgi:hypothetical protein